MKGLTDENQKWILGFMSSSKHVWNQFEHQLYRHLKNQDLLPVLKNKKVLALISGGLDSMALLNVLARLPSIFASEIEVLHIHHGQDFQNIKQSSYRDRACEFVKEQVKDLGFIFLTEEFSEPGRALHSEAEFRDFRNKIIQKTIRKRNIDIILTAHHKDDLLETRLIRLIRGTGPRGLTAMRVWDEKQKILRPFLNFQRSDLENYMKEIKASYVSDPSNCENTYLRNWMRNVWLPQLEEKVPGALLSLSRSLEVLNRNQNYDTESNFCSKMLTKDGGLSLSGFLKLSREGKKNCLAHYIFNLGVRDFRHTQIEEILKKLDSRQIVHRFTVARLRWDVNAERILAQPK